MKKLVFASNNAHKLDEVRIKLADLFEILSLKDIECNDDIPETANTFEGNAELKAVWINEKYNINCFADDSGIEIEALDGKPGVFSARYAGEKCSSEDNNQKVLKELKGKENRKARFVTSICLKLNGETHFFRGEVKGNITEEYHGEKGFGYDPIFIPEGERRTFAQMSTKEKNNLSHRALALNKMMQFLNAIQ